VKLPALSRAAVSAQPARGLVGPAGYLALLLGSVGLILVAPFGRLWLAAGLCLAANGLFHPGSLRRLAAGRWLAMLGGLVLANALWLGPADQALGPLAYSGEGLRAGLQMAVRALVVMVAVDGFAGAVDVGQVAGLFERAGLRGLGFAVGVAFNLLPSLRRSGRCAWHSLWMRGGLRQQRWRALRLLLVTVVANALRRAEDIALAAEARGFAPERCRAAPLPAGRLDWLVGLGVAAAGLVVVAWR
jgi:energy-coupling factor transporter transmembrane protein EcfT